MASDMVNHLWAKIKAKPLVAIGRFTFFSLLMIQSVDSLRHTQQLIKIETRLRYFFSVFQYWYTGSTAFALKQPF